MRISNNLKKFTSIFVIITFGALNSFAAVVSDNDGASFITKAEFDSLNNTFQAALNEFNTGIDNKLSGAINSYISGVKQETEEVIKPLVTNYKDIKWKNDLFLKLNIRKFTNYNTYTDTGLKWQVPQFGKYRIIRAGRFYMGAMDYRDTDARVFFLHFGGTEYCRFPADDGWLPSGEGASTSRTTSCGPVVVRCKNNDTAPELRTTEQLLDYERQMTDTAWPSVAWYDGGNIGDPAYVNWRWQNIVPNTNGGAIPITKATDDVLAWQLKWYNRNPQWSSTDTYTYAGPYQSRTYRIKTSMSSYGAAELGTWNTGNPPNQIWDNNYLGTFNTPVYYNKSENNNQWQRDLSAFRVMFLGMDTNTKVNCAIRNDVKLFSTRDEYNFKDSELGSFLNGKRRAYIVPSYNSKGLNNTFYFVDPTDTATPSEVRLSLPLWPQYYLKNLINPDFVANGNKLAIGGGIPIASNILSKGTLNVKIKYEVGNDDLTATTTPSQEVYMSFKKTAFNDETNTDNYYRDSSSTQLKDIRFTRSATNDTYEVNIPVNVDDNVWFRIGPKERTGTGLFAKLTDMQVKLIIS